MTETPAGWFADGSGGQRYFDGRRGGSSFPMGVAPGKGGQPGVCLMTGAPGRFTRMGLCAGSLLAYTYKRRTL